MKFVLNKCFGGASISDAAVEILDRAHQYDFSHTDPDLIALIEEEGTKFCSGYLAELVVVEVPDDATDWELDEYDGIESITYVLDGKLYHV